MSSVRTRLSALAILMAAPLAACDDRPSTGNATAAGTPAVPAASATTTPAAGAALSPSGVGSVL